MKEFGIMLIEGLMNSLEEFFESLTAPSTKFTLNAFLYSLGFLALSVITKLFKLPCFVQWQECIACSVLMLIIVLIDSSVRTDIKSGMSKLKEVTNKFSHFRDEDEYLIEEDTQQETTENDFVEAGENDVIQSENVTEEIENGTSE